ncbi:helix-turn-helix domain-containing protein [Algoriphagus aquimarinus]|uniref:Helix-turn-helix transcriptional regulator n=1 Tax=Algoriphagus aquimarinus TaxID=237018 RepID=A0A5C7B2G2_9BACT|nr:helix-turn-helix domain-containing protein [Algoriphagus aquimarinus]TXE14637.1 helix-turn-helix transcriptional regulator [Algoriphagus aquimarinus]
MDSKLIKSEKEYQSALERLDQLFNAKIGTEESDEADVLAVLIDAYDKNNFSIQAIDENIKTFSSHLDKRGSKDRTEFEIKAKAFAIGELIKEERKLADMTQEQLADKIGAKKSFISRIENGKSDIQLSTLYRLLEYGLGKKISFTVK